MSFVFEVGGVRLLGELGLRARGDLPGGDESVDSISGHFFELGISIIDRRDIDEEIWKRRRREGSV